ncbi:MAG: FIST C-terminal domain-containing protein [Gammaproteobacteria bacterium]|nr:FIST C-terminal domain-containing protein [Gammaproteobacteria bacterium]
MKTLQILLSGQPTDTTSLTELAAISPQLVLVFGSVELLDKPDFFSQLRAACPEAKLVGCSTAGEISRKGVHEKCCVVTAIHFESDIRLQVASATVTGMDTCHTAGAEVGKALVAPDLRGVLLFGKGVGVNGSEMIEGIQSVVGNDIPITGGLAGDDGAFNRTLTLTPTGIFPDALVALGLYGHDLLLGYGSFGGWQAFGPVRKITRCNANILYELDGEPALNIYKQYLGDHARDLPSSGLLFPFEMLNQDLDTLGLIRTILGINENDGSLVLAGDIDPEGFLRLMHASTDNLIDGATAAARQTLTHLPAAPPAGVAILVSCVGRRLVMGDEVDEEVEAVAAILGRQSQLTGFYSYGEISPFSTTTVCKLHNQTMTVTYLGERQADK